MFTNSSTKKGLLFTNGLVIASLVVAATLFASGSSAATKNAGADRASHAQARAKPTKVLTIASSDPATSLNPATAGNSEATAIYEELAYEPLINLQNGGVLTPGLATSWNYVGQGNIKFVLHLRSGARFSDGSKVTAAAVAKSINYFRNAKGPLIAYASTISSVTATGPLTVQVVGASPDPEYPLLFSRLLMAGDVISSAGVNDPTKLQNATLGAGPYVYSASQSVSGSTYTYVPNKFFYDQKAIHWGKVVVKVINNDTTAISALQTGQVNIALVAATTASTAGSNLKVYTAPSNFEGLYLLNQQAGTPLANPLVRQALNMAIDRPTLTNALFGKFAQPSDEMAVPGYDGWDPSYANHYSYNIAMAKSLLTQAGYPNGFTLTVDSLNEFGLSTLTTAMAGQLAQIGVTLNINVAATIGTYVSNSLSKNFDTMAMYYGGLPMYVIYQQVLAANSGLFNPYQIDNQTLDTLAAAGAPLDTSSRLQVWKQMQDAIVNQAVELPVLYIDETFVTTNNLKGFSVGAGNINFDPLVISPAK
jgi:peptide/nickel transport system substrate-binding protein